ncbi:MAG: ubiquinone-binding protein, partial [Proteobacteria bacterium]
LDSFATGYQAGMQVNIKGVRVDFSTVNTLIDHSEFLAVAMTLAEGPFKKLQGYWRFIQLSELGSKVQLELSYEIKSKLIGRIFAKGFDQVASQLVSDFVSRAGEVYA